MKNILVIDDERSIRRTLKEILEYEGFKIDEAEDGEDGIAKALSKNYDIILCDIKMPKKDGIEVLETVLASKPESLFIMVSGHGTIETAIEAVKKGAYDFLQKPIDLNRLLVTMRNATEKETLVAETKELKKRVHKQKTTEIIGESAAILAVKQMIDKVAVTEARVLVTGENGTGKELVARQLHEKSARAAAPFVEVNCAAIPSELIESELFGHEKGAFTSAIKQRIGKFEAANNGTLFLDEIGDMTLSAQAKVLRALQENRITRVGGEKDIAVNPRLIAATNKNLKEEIAKGNFREDLYHRLSVIIIHLPPLRERSNDIPLLSKHFLKLICDEFGGVHKEIVPEALKQLATKPFTGNIRELRNIIERLVILGGKEISVHDVEQYS